MSLFRLLELGEVPSTNEVVRDALMEGEPEGLAVGARSQSGGYGRQGRTWASPPGGMYLSVLLRPQAHPSPLSTLSLAVAVAVRRAASRCVAPEMAQAILVKWPNDVVVAAPSGRLAKLVGISLEQLGGGVCVGIGVNVLAPPERIPVGGRNEPCWLFDLGMQAPRAAAVPTVRDAVLRELEAAYRQWSAEGLGALREEYERFDALEERHVVVEDRRGGVLAEGRARGIDAQGQLLVENLAGSLVAVSSGEAHLRSIG